MRRPLNGGQSELCLEGEGGETMTSDFVLRLRSEPHVQDGVSDLSGLLREGLRTYGLRLISAEEIAVEEPGLGVWEAADDTEPPPPRGWLSC